MLFKNSLQTNIRRLTEDILNEQWLQQISQQNTNNAGILDGKEIIFEFLTHAEYGCAFEHLDYVINTSNIILSPEQENRTNELRKKLNTKK